MKLAAKLVALVTVIAACGSGMFAGCGEIRNPMAKPIQFVATPVPADFAIVLDESSDTYYARQDIRQVVTSTDLMSRTTYTTRQDYKDTVASQFTQDHPLNPGQLQTMWNEVTKYKLMENARTWYYWEGFPDSFRRTEQVMQIRANGKVVSYKQLNHWGFKLRDLALQVEGVRFPVTHGDGSPGTPVVAPTTPPTTPPSTTPAAPSTAPAIPAADAPAAIEIPSTSTAATAPAATQP
ncbi:MAG: hypothetical protein WCI73_02030 [Phycisphaerae bacterium]